MKILHLMDDSPGGFISWRVEKSATSASNHGHQTFYAGPGQSIRKNHPFVKIQNVEWSPAARKNRSYDWHCVKKQISRAVNEIRPDIVHAHNIFSAKMISEFKIPFVYDDHEYWPSYVKMQLEVIVNVKKKPTKKSSSFMNPKKVWAGFFRRVNNYNYVRMISEWEQEIVASVPTLTTSEIIVKNLKQQNKNENVFTVPNFPSFHEVKDFGEPKFHSSLSSIFAGLGSMVRAHKNAEGLNELFRTHDIGQLAIIGRSGDTSDVVRYLGFLPSRKLMYEEMSRHSIGLIPFKKHWSHQYVSLNKAYEYAHAGLFVICTSTYETMIEELGEACSYFEDYDDLLKKLSYYKNNLEDLYNSRLQAFRIARKNLIWENHEKNIFQAYELC